MEKSDMPQIGTVLFSKDLKIIGINTIAKEILNFKDDYFGKDLKQLHSAKAHPKIAKILKLLQNKRENITITMPANVLGKVLLLNISKLEMTSADDIVYVMNFVDISKPTEAQIDKETGVLEVRKIPIFYQNSVIYLDHSEVFFVKSEGNYCRLFTKDKTYFIRCSLRDFSFNLPCNKFFRSHKQYIINVEHVKRVELLENHQALAYFDNEKIPPALIARRKVKEFLQLLEQKEK